MAVVSCVIAITSVVISVITYHNTVVNDRKSATLEAYNRLQAEVFDPLNSYTPMEISDICENTKSVEYKVLSGYLARIEHFCIGVNEKIYDKDVFYKMAHGYFDGHILYHRIEPILMSKKNAEQYYSNTYSVLEQMNKKSTKEI